MSSAFFLLEKLFKSLKPVLSNYLKMMNEGEVYAGVLFNLYLEGML